MNHVNFQISQVIQGSVAKLLRFTVFFLCGCTATSSTQAQSLWEVSPYRIEVWVALQPHPRVDPAWQQQLPAEIQRLAENRIGSVWTLNARATPEEHLGDVLRGSSLDLEQLRQLNEEPLQNVDKLMLVVVQNDSRGYRLTVREFDLNTRQSAGPQSLTVADGQMLGSAALDLMCDVFVPVVRIERIEDTTVIAAVRGGALERPEQSTRRWRLPTQVQVGDVLQPLLLRTDRNGRIGPDGVKLVEWTVLIATERTGSSLTCEFHSGYRQPFSTRRSSRLQQMAYRVKPQLESTTLKLINRRTPDEPLVGYEVYGRPPDDEQATKLIGRTDWNGELTIDRDPAQPVQVLFVRNGQQVLGKLPIVPGAQALLVAPLRNDDLRLEAEGFLLGVQDSLVDLVAQREVLAARIRREIESGELDKADELLRQLRRLDTQEDFARRVQQRKQTLSSGDAQVQQKIDELFAQTRSLLGKYLNQEQVDALSRAIEAARADQTPGDLAAKDEG